MYGKILVPRRRDELLNCKNLGTWGLTSRRDNKRELICWCIGLLCATSNGVSFYKVKENIVTSIMFVHLNTKTSYITIS